ncbi:MAG: YkgJ family cysteine cluster protein [Desulfobacteraceae bacterium]|nr:MAG: YkgJ family cysteine cluster protein [Desulfobacteraceae bacterium]
MKEIGILSNEKRFPAGREPLGKAKFRFACHSGVECFTQCCRRVDIILYPYDVITLKNRLGLRSGDFLAAHTGVVGGENPYFPTLMLKMAETEEGVCPFVGAGGCTVYDNRPTACRTYPLERAVARHPVPGEPREYYFIARHSYCHGHDQEKEWTVKEWLRDQRLLSYNMMNELWTEVDTLFGTNPWQGEGAYGPLQQLAFMVCYNIDGFRDYVAQASLLGQFKLSRAAEGAIAKDDEALLRFGFDWLKYLLAGQPTLKPRRR